MPDKSGPKKCSRRKWMSRFVKLRCNALLSAVKSCAMTIERWSVECNHRAWKTSGILSQLKISPKTARDLFRLHIMEFNSNNFSTTKRQCLNVGCKRTDWGDRSQYNWNILGTRFWICDIREINRSLIYESQGTRFMTFHQAPMTINLAIIALV